MEAMRILKAAGIKPRRTIRIALWTGEEQGLKGSVAYVAEHFGARPEPEDPAQKDLPLSLRKPTGPFKPKPEHARLSAYFNVDNGGGKIRGIYAEESSAAAAIFEDWLRPLRDLGAGTVTLRHTGATDHVSFLDAGLPGFQFIQDELDYMAMTHHTNMDTYDHLEREDLTQAAVVLASFLYDAAMRPEKMPRKPMPAD
jgi:Zn-dependent M28 family amino/carboxypeptidase